MTTAEAPADPPPDTDNDDVIAARRQYARDIYPRLERDAGVPMLDFTIHKVLGRFPEWSYEVRQIREQEVHYFHRQFVDPELEFVPLPKEERTPRRIIGHDKQGGIGVAVVDNRVFGDDLRCVVGMEEQLLAPVTYAIRQQRIRHRYKEEAEKFKTASEELQEGELFTEQEKVAMSLLTHLENSKDIQTALNTSAGSASKPLQAAYKRIGILSSKTALTELMLVAIAARIASIDHIPADRTSELDASDREVLHAHYHPDPAERAAARKTQRGRKDGRIGKMYEKTNIQGKRLLIIYAVKDGIIELPNIADLRPAEQGNTAA